MYEKYKNQQPAELQNTLFLVSVYILKQSILHSVSCWNAKFYIYMRTYIRTYLLLTIVTVSSQQRIQEKGTFSLNNISKALQLYIIHIIPFKHELSLTVKLILQLYSVYILRETRKVNLCVIRTHTESRKLHCFGINVAFHQTLNWIISYHIVSQNETNVTLYLRIRSHYSDTLFFFSLFQRGHWIL